MNNVMKRYFILLSLPMLLLSACDKAEFAAEQEVHTLISDTDVYHAVIYQDDQTKTAVSGEYTLSWSAGDEISIFTSTANQRYAFAGQDGDVEGDFGKVLNNAFYVGNDISTTYALYPYRDDNAIDEDGVVRVYFPTEQRYVPGTFATGTAPMLAVTKEIGDLDLSFKNLSGFLVIPATGDVTVTGIELRALNGEAISGWFGATGAYGQTPEVSRPEDLNFAPFYSSYNNVADIISMTFDQPVQLDAQTPTDFWFVLPPVTMKGGFAVTFTTTDIALQLKTTKSRTITRNVVNRMEVTNVSLESMDWQDLLDPKTGLPATATFEEGWWGETHTAKIKYFDVDNLRTCIATCDEVDSEGNALGIWGDKVGVPFLFYWNLNTNWIDVPMQYFGFSYSDWASVPEAEAANPVYFADWYYHNNAMYSYKYGSPNAYYNSVGYDNCSWYNDGFFYFNLRYFIPGTGSFSAVMHDVVAHISGYDIHQTSTSAIEVGTEYQIDEYKNFYFYASPDVNNIWFTFVEGRIPQTKIVELAEDIKGGNSVLHPNEDGEAVLSMTFPATGKYTVVAVVDDGTYTSMLFDYALPGDAPVDLTITTSDSDSPADSFYYTLKGSGLANERLRVKIVKTSEVPATDLVHWAMGSFDYYVGYNNVNNAGEEGFKVLVENLQDETSYTVVAWATNGIYMAAMTAEYTTAAHDWVSLGTGLYTDDVVCSLFDVAPITVSCEIFEAQDAPGLYKFGGFQQELAAKLLDATMEEMANEEGNYWRKAFVVVDARDPQAVTIPRSEDYGISVDAGQNFIDGLSSFNQGGWSVSTGTLSNGVIRFTKIHGLGAAYNGNLGYYANKHGAFALYMPGATFTNPQIGENPFDDEEVAW